MSGKRLTDLERKVLVGEYISGKSLLIISKEYDVARATIARWVKRFAKIRGQGRPRYAEKMVRRLLGWEVDQGDSKRI